VTDGESSSRSQALPSELLTRADQSAARAERLLRGLAIGGSDGDPPPSDLGWAIRAIEALPDRSLDAAKEL
jgi:hypothetical protein